MNKIIGSILMIAGIAVTLAAIFSVISSYYTYSGMAFMTGIILIALGGTFSYGGYVVFRRA